MSIRERLGHASRLALLGRRSMPQTVDLALQSPQSEVAVWLCGSGEPQDVTALHAVACPSPASVCIGFPDAPGQDSANAPLALHFVERGGLQRRLGSMQLRQQCVLRFSGPQLRVYRATACVNQCISPLRNWSHGLYATLGQIGKTGKGRVKLSAVDGLVNEVMFNCPRPVGLLSLRMADGENIVPVNLMGPVGDEHFAFALNRSNGIAANVIAGACLALSTVPWTCAQDVRQLGGNHRRRSVLTADIAFTMRPSATLGVPVPEFALSVTELKLEQHLSLGSHTLCVARVLTRETIGSGDEFHRIHGAYASLRKQPMRAGQR